MGEPYFFEMKIFTFSGILGQQGVVEPRWTVEEGVGYSNFWRDHRCRSQVCFVDGTTLPLSIRIPVVGFRVLDGYIYQHASNSVGGFELREDLSRHSRDGSFYLCLRNQGFAPSVTAHAHFQMPVYSEKQPGSRDNCSFWLLEPGEYLAISFWGKSWEVSNLRGQILIERIGQDRRFLMYGDMNRMPDRVRLYYLKQQLVEIGRKFNSVADQITRITGGDTSRYCRPGYGYLGDPLP